MIEHVTINTRSLEKSILFYEKYIGMQIADDLRENGMPIVFMASDMSDETKLELIHSESDYYGEGISIGFRMDNLDERRNFFIEEGLAVSEIISPAPNVRFFFVTDPNGLKVQIMSE